MCCSLIIYVGTQKRCPICHTPGIPVGPPVHGNEQHFECASPKCTVTGFRVADDAKLLSIWLGKQHHRKSKDQTDNHTKCENVNLRSIDVLIQKRQIWSQLCKEFSEREKKTTIEQRAIRKLRDWSPKYGEGYY